MRSPDLRRTVEILHSHRPGALATDVHPQAPAPHASFAAGGREEKIEYLGLLCVVILLIFSNLAFSNTDDLFF